MAAINLSSMYMFDSWPGVPMQGLGIPADGWDGTTHSCVTTPVYPVGTKITQYEDSSLCPGYYTMIYLQFHDGTDLGADAGDVSDGYALCFHADGTATNDGTLAGWYIVTNDLTNSDGTVGGPGAFAAADLSGDEYGWFWCGGVCPITDVTKLNADMKTNGDVKIGTQVACSNDGTGCAALGPACPTVMYDSTTIGDVTHSVLALGWCWKADA